MNGRILPLTKGYYVLVDEEDYDFLAQWKWHACISPSGNVYAMRNSPPINGKRTHIMMHRIINKTPDGFRTDHINGNGLDNRKSNLRTVTPVQNGQNRRPNKKGTSKYKGVFWHKQHCKWYAQIQVNKKSIFLGLFTDEDLAAKAYEKAAKEKFGEFNREIKYV